MVLYDKKEDRKYQNMAHGKCQYLRRHEVLIYELKGSDIILGDRQCLHENHAIKTD